MRHTYVVGAAVATAAMLGCSAAHEVNPQSDASTDAGGDARDVCTFAGVPRCNVCGHGNTCPPVHNYCTYGLCLPDVSAEPNGCSVADPVCADSRVCIFDPAPGVGAGLGACMPEAFCDEAAAEAYPLLCTWSDLTLRVAGAPHDTVVCPPPSFAGTPFCGSPCEPACAVFHDMAGVVRPICIGRSDRRQLGICGPAPSGPSPVGPTPFCHRGRAAGDDVCGNSVPGGQTIVELEGTTCVCVVFQHAHTAAADGLSDYGFATSIEGCRAYRALYPADIQCVIDRDWHTLP